MRLPKTIDQIPKGTPLFGKCAKCGCILIYPPIQIPRKPNPSERIGLTTIQWVRYCIDCAVSKLKKTKPMDIIPDVGWDLVSQAVIKNPWIK